MFRATVGTVAFATMMAWVLSCSAQEKVHVNGTDAIWSRQLVLSGSPVCNAEVDMPYELMRQAHFGRARTMACTDAVEDYLNYLEISKVPFFSKKFAESRIALRIAREYRDSCLISFAAVTDPNGGYAGNRQTANHLVHVSSPDEVERVRRSVGSLSKFRDPHYCSATLVGHGAGKVGILTAVHCLGVVEPVGNTGSHELTSPFSEIVFSSIAGEQISVELGAGFSNKIFQESNEDVVVLPVPGRHQDDYLPLANFASPVWEPLLLMGVSPFLAKLKAIEEAGRPAALTEIIAVSLEPYCVLMARGNDGDLHHNCQTTNGQSGSAALTVRDNKFFVSGLHSKSDGGEHFGCSDQAMPTLNAGVALIDR
jgi:hypothetical protein